MQPFVGFPTHMFEFALDLGDPIMMSRLTTAYMKDSLWLQEFIKLIPYRSIYYIINHVTRGGNSFVKMIISSTFNIFILKSRLPLLDGGVGGASRGWKSSPVLTPSHVNANCGVCRRFPIGRVNR